MKAIISISSIIVLLTSFKDVNSDAICGKSNQLSDLESIIKSVGANVEKCKPGHIELECSIMDKSSISKLSCFLMDKPGKTQGGIFLISDYENTGKSCDNKQNNSNLHKSATNSEIPIDVRKIKTDKSFNLNLKREKKTKFSKSSLNTYKMYKKNAEKHIFDLNQEQNDPNKIYKNNHNFNLKQKKDNGNKKNNKDVSNFDLNQRDENKKNNNNAPNFELFDEKDDQNIKIDNDAPNKINKDAPTFEAFDEQDNQNDNKNIDEPVLDLKKEKDDQNNKINNATPTTILINELILGTNSISKLNPTTKILSASDDKLSSVTTSESETISENESELKSTSATSDSMSETESELKSTSEPSLTSNDKIASVTTPGSETMSETLPEIKSTSATSLISNDKQASITTFNTETMLKTEPGLKHKFALSSNLIISSDSTHDAVELAELSDKPQIALDVITKWSDIHEMSVNAGKCGVMPINCTYGGKLFGISEVCTKPIQMAADKALRLIARVSKVTAMNRLKNEFGIQSINLVCSRLRERAHFKWPSSKTWIADLICQSLKARSSTWIYNIKLADNTSNAKLEQLDQLAAAVSRAEIGLNMIAKIRTGSYWTTERLAKSELISKIYRGKCPCWNVNQFIPRLFRICNDNINVPPIQAKMKLVGKLLRGESKKSLLQLRKEKKSIMQPSMVLETLMFMNGIRVARALILDGIKCSPTPLNRYPVGMEFLERRRGVG
ncbi:hypothetical protein BB561_004496 [Smittium simulii]|uniref:Uncharacterized protein n=1 Tax=Smittium simulii TaxID=133385 RepID=A0A2T9YG17_9FUNG|nr:hypothetical protein BB561_004496 [Smittium simulii]